MDRDRFLIGLQIVSNLGLVVGLVLVGIQIRNASYLTAVTLAMSAYQQETDHQNAWMGENAAEVRARAETEPESLTPADIRVLVAQADWVFSMMRKNATMESLGMFGQEWRAVLPVVGWWLASNPVTRKYLLEYDDQQARALGQDWLQVMQDEARKTPPDGGKRFIEDMLRTARASRQSAGADSATPAQEQVLPAP